VTLKLAETSVSKSRPSVPYWHFIMPAPPDIVGKGIMFLGCPVVLHLTVCLFVQSDIATMISHEWLKQF